MKLLSEKQLAIPQAGTYQFNYSNHNHGNNTLIYQMITSKYTETRTMIQE
jgi:hypothetical protein